MNEQENNQPMNQESAENCAEQLKECLVQKDEWKDRCIRTAAEFENYKKRTEKEKLLWISSAQSSVINDVLNIVDDFDRAFSQPAGDDQSRAGFELIYKSLQKMLEKYGVQEITEIGEFDPNLHEAIMQVESADHKPGDIVQILQKGYMFKGQVLRPAKVSVAK
jgi:molecular chaperone GrpE